MTQNKAKAFRKQLAEMGTEMTPDEALKAYKAMRNFVRRAKSTSMEEIWEIADHDEKYAELYMKAKDS